MVTFQKEDQMINYWERGDHSWSEDSLRFIHTPTQKSQELFYYIQEIGHFKARKPYYTERANLPSFLIKYTLSGTGTLIYNENQYSIKPGDIFFIDCQQYQYYKTTSEKPWEMCWLHFNGANTQAFYQEFIKNGTNVFHTNNNHIYLIIQNLLRLEHGQSAQTDFLVSLSIHELLNELIIQKQELDFKTKDIPTYVVCLKDYLDVHFKDKITLMKLEKQYNINKYQLTKEFSRYIGIPPIEYHIANKITYSKDLLRSSDATIKMIALEIGIENVAYFSRLFKQKTGLTPSQYRKIG